MKVIHTDARGRTTLLGHANEMFAVTEQGDGSILLQPALVITQAQREYDNSPQLQALLSRAMSSPITDYIQTERGSDASG